MALPQKTMIMLVATSVLGSLGAAAGTALLMRGKPAAPAEVDPHAEAKKKKKEEEAPKTVHSLGEMVVNLSDTSELRFAKISVAIGLPEKIEDKELKDYDPILRDIVIKIVSSRSFNSLHERGALDKLKADLLSSMGDKLPKNEITQVYLENFAMQ